MYYKKEIYDYLNDKNIWHEITEHEAVLNGEKDHAGSTKRYNRAWHRETGIPIEWIPGAGHNSNTDAPETVNALIQRFVGVL